MNYTGELKKKLKRGDSIDSALLHLRKIGASPVETIKAIKEVKNVGLDEAKALFTQSEAWSDVAEQSDKLHEEILNALGKDF